MQCVVTISSNEERIFDVDLPVYIKNDSQYAVQHFYFFEESGILAKRMISEREGDYIFNTDFYVVLGEKDMWNLQNPNSNQEEFTAFKDVALRYIKEIF